MTTPQLHRQLLEQLRQWILPGDSRHLQGYAEIVGAILQFALRLFESLATLSEPSQLSSSQSFGTPELLYSQSSHRCRNILCSRGAAFTTKLGRATDDARTRYQHVVGQVLSD
jgi:hypothetical protein